MPRVVIGDIKHKMGGDYPAPFDAPLAGREARSVTEGNGIRDFNANHVLLPPGCLSSQRHWHEGEDELVVILSGSATLIDDDGRHIMSAGDVAVFPRNDGSGHVLKNEGSEPCILLAISKPEASKVHYSDIDLIWTPDGGERHRDGTLTRGADKPRRHDADKAIRMLCRRPVSMRLQLSTEWRQAAEALRRRLADGQSAPGFGHPLHAGVDPRAGASLDSFDAPLAHEELRHAAEELVGLAPNVDFALSAMTARFELPQDAPLLIFAAASSVGWNCARS